jgi:uncharacterized protein (TIGR02186 family)
LKALKHTFVWFIFLTAALPASGRELAIELTKDAVPITANFIGSDLMLYGASEGGGDVLVVVRGPNKDQTIRRKKKSAIIWINDTEVTFLDAPSYYFLASTRPLSEFLSDRIARKEQIGYPAMALKVKDFVDDYIIIEDFRKALIRNKQKQGLYGEGPGLVRYKGKHLFRTRLHFPANVPVGDYNIDIYVFKDGKIVNKESTVLPVQKKGIGAQVYNFAHRHALSYGILAILVAALAGWLASVMFRKT